MTLSPECEELTQQSDSAKLLTRLHAVELRLGTGAELPGDLECAQAIGHRLNNVLTAVRLRQALEALKHRPPAGE